MDGKRFDSNQLNPEGLYQWAFDKVEEGGTDFNGNAMDGTLHIFTEQVADEEGAARPSRRIFKRINIYDTTGTEGQQDRTSRILANAYKAAHGKKFQRNGADQVSLLDLARSLSGLRAWATLRHNEIDGRTVEQVGTNWSAEPYARRTD